MVYAGGLGDSVWRRKKNGTRHVIRRRQWAQLRMVASEGLM